MHEGVSYTRLYGKPIPALAADENEMPLKAKRPISFSVYFSQTSHTFEMSSWRLATDILFVLRGNCVWKEKLGDSHQQWPSFECLTSRRLPTATFSQKCIEYSKEWTQPSFCSLRLLQTKNSWISWLGSRGGRGAKKELPLGRRISRIQLTWKPPFFRPTQNASRPKFVFRQRRGVEMLFNTEKTPRWKKSVSWSLKVLTPGTST